MNLGTASEYLDDLSVRGLIPSARAACLHLHGPPRRPQPRALIWVRRVSRRGRGHSARPSSVATRAQYIYTTSGKIHIEMSRHQVFKNITLLVQCSLRRAASRTAAVVWLYLFLRPTPQRRQKPRAREGCFRREKRIVCPHSDRPHSVRIQDAQKLYIASVFVATSCISEAYIASYCSCGTFGGCKPCFW